MEKTGIENIDLRNTEFQNAWNMIQKTHRSVFLTGKAGTGKSTFLRYICAHTEKKHVVLAPTGIAAVNVQGQTLHSFFKIPFKPLLPDDPEFSPRRINKTLRYSKDKIKLIKNLELIIIDEISMVRADVIDFIDKVLRYYTQNQREPFGGKQLLFVGDIFQLEPVVTRDMREILKRYYKQFFFFNAQVFEDLGLVPIELRKIYRQNDDDFIRMLDRVRVNRATAEDIRLINSRVNEDAGEPDDKFVITLATRRDTVDSINDEHMRALKSKEYQFDGKIEGNYPDNDLPTLKELTLKTDAQVIFIRNDREGRWFNGTIGKVSALGDDAVVVTLEDGSEYSLEQETWENIQYTYNEKEKKVEENVLGTFTQYPIKPAWALTVHKSQGLTFNNIVIDFAGGAFSSGQTYVALSRCRSLEGITLLKPLSERDVIVNSGIVEFSKRFNDQRQIDEAINQERAYRLLRKANLTFRAHDFSSSVDALTEANKIVDISSKPAILRLIKTKLYELGAVRKEIARRDEVIERQDKMLKELALEYVAMGDDTMGYGQLADEPTVAYGKKAPKLDEVALKAGMANYEKALRIYPKCTEAMMGKARLWERIGETDKAERTLKEAIAADKKNCDIRLELAWLYERERDIPAAIKELKRAEKCDKTRYEPHERMARIYTRIGLENLAEEHEEKAKRLKNTMRKRKKKE